MKKLLGIVVLGLMVAMGVSAEEMKEWVDARSTVKVADLTVGDLKALADIQSVDRQEARYVGGAAVASFLLPGLGQFKTGDTVAGTLNLVGFTTLVGATVYGAWTLLPEDMKANGLSHDGRHNLMKSYWNNDFAKIAPAVGVMAGGAALSMIYRFWSAGDAKSRAVENLKSGTVTFEPTTIDGRFGMMARMHAW